MNHLSKPQPEPVKGDGRSVQDLVREDIDQRKLHGMRTYGTLLYRNNGRDALRDAYEEALDLVFYLRQAIEERGSK
jgi:hypothetical protein